MNLYHFSEDPNIRLFEPRPSRPIPGVSKGEPLVWAIDEWHSPMYSFPRECPRVLLWPVDGSNSEDVRRWMGDGDPRMAAYVESGWTSRIESCELYRYSFDPLPFKDLRDAGMHVSPALAEPVSVEPMGYLPDRLKAAKVELKPVDSLQPLAEARLWESSLHFSGIRLRNAREGRWRSKMWRLRAPRPA